MLSDAGIYDCNSVLKALGIPHEGITAFEASPSYGGSQRSNLHWPVAASTRAAKEHRPLCKLPSLMPAADRLLERITGPVNLGAALQLAMLNASSKAWPL